MRESSSSDAPSRTTDRPATLPRRSRAVSVMGGLGSVLLLAGCGTSGSGFAEHPANDQTDGPTVTYAPTTAPTTAVPDQPAYTSSPYTAPTAPIQTTLPPLNDPGSTSTGRPRRSQPTRSAGPEVGTAKGSVRVTRTVATGLDVPWGLARLPDGTVLVTTRDDYHLWRLAPATGKMTDLGRIPGVVSNVGEGGEAGLLGVAVSPNFTSDHRIYLYWSTSSDNRIGYVVLTGHGVGRPTTIVTGIPHGVHHDGGRLAFGPDGLLYASTGESGDPSLSQDKGSLGGKILRMTANGRAPVDNPFPGSLVYSYGHRNVQGLAFDAAGRLFASEFGDHDYDELNWIRAGHNYGWPQSQGDTSIPGITGPVAEFGTESDSPSGIAIASGSVWMAALAGERLYRIPLDGRRLVAQPTSFLTGRYGRLRSVLALDDHTLLVTTSNRDGRSSPRSGDDRILMLHVT